MEYEQYQRINQLSTDLEDALSDYSNHEDLWTDIKDGYAQGNKNLARMRMLQAEEAIKLIAKEVLLILAEEPKTVEE